MKTVPTLLTIDRFELMDQLELFQKYYDRIQIDVADGVIVPNVTTQIDEITELVSKDFLEVNPDVSFDFHLMVKNFKPELDKIADLQKQNIKVNAVLINASEKPNIPKLQALYSFTIGLDIFPAVEIGYIDRQYDLKNLSFIQVMTVEPGFQGSPFIPDMLNKITQLREHHYSGEILIDGGVNSITIPQIKSVKNKPDILCIGSYLTKSGDELEKRVNGLKECE